MAHPEINPWGVLLFKTFVLDADERRQTLIFAFQRESAFVCVSN